MATKGRNQGPEEVRLIRTLYCILRNNAACLSDSRREFSEIDEIALLATQAAMSMIEERYPGIGPQEEPRG